MEKELEKIIYLENECFGEDKWSEMSIREQLNNPFCGLILKEYGYILYNLIDCEISENYNELNAKVEILLQNISKEKLAEISKSIQTEVSKKCGGEEKMQNFLKKEFLNLKNYECEILRVGVVTSERNKGKGAELMQELIDNNQGKRMLLEVAEHNTPAIKLYEKFGFKKIALRKNFYGNGKNACTYERI
jgi:ribosomal protein S18 acetylase RimI-like enzyme